MSNRSSCRILKFLGMDVKCDKSPSMPEKTSGSDTAKLGGVQSQEEEWEPLERELEKDENTGPYANITAAELDKGDK